MILKHLCAAGFGASLLFAPVAAATETETTESTSTESTTETQPTLEQQAETFKATMLAFGERVSKLPTNAEKKMVLMAFFQNILNVIEKDTGTVSEPGQAAAIARWEEHLTNLYSELHDRPEEDMDGFIEFLSQGFQQPALVRSLVRIPLLRDHMIEIAK